MSAVRVPGGKLFSRYLDRTVEIPPFTIGRFPVTVVEYTQFARETGYRTTAEQVGWAYVFEAGKWSRLSGVSFRDGGHPGRQGEDHPVVLVSRLDAEAYCRHRRGRLPRPEEWEWAAGAGARHPWGEDAAGLSSCVAGRREFATRARGDAPMSAASPWGCLDMLGNVWEWVDAESKHHPGCGVFMGGGWSDPPEALASWSSHDDDPPTFCVDDVGFRLVLDDAA